MNPAPLLLRAAPAVLPFFLMAGCGTDPLLGPGSHDVDFGDYYEVITSPAGDGLLPAPPRLDGDSLRLALEYGGGCAEHDFDLRHRRRGATLEVWLHHDDKGDLCLALLYKPITRALPASVLDADRIRLLAPPDTSFVLR